MPKNYRSSIPKGAVEVVDDRHPNGVKKSASFFAGGDKVGVRQWSAEGWLEHEYGLKDGKKHGRDYGFIGENVLAEMTPYRNGVMHGTGVQWAADGSVLITYRMVNGAGLDLWCGHSNSTLSEEHYWPKPGELGYDRDWNDDERTICQEYFFRDTGYHGVWRAWNARGKLSRGYPRYYVNGRRVTKRQYLKAAATDPTLPPFRIEENQPYRRLPAEYVLGRANRPPRGGGT